MLASLLFYMLVWTLASVIAALMFSLTAFRKAPECGADEAAELERELAELDAAVFYRGGQPIVIFDSSEVEVR